MTIKQLLFDAVTKTVRKNLGAPPAYYRSKYGWVTKDGQLKTSSTTECHRNIAGGGQTVKAVWTLIQGYEDNDDFAVFLDYALDRELSPWRSIIPSREEADVDGVDTWSTEFVRNAGVFTTAVDKVPVNVWTNFCISTRGAFEHPNNFKRWVKLVENGVHPGLAYYVKTLIGNIVDDKSPILAQGCYYHGDTASLYSENVIRNFCNGSVENASHPFTSGGYSYGLVDRCWKSGPFIDERGHSLKSSDGLLDERTYFKDFQSLLEFCKREEKRYGLPNLGSDWFSRRREAIIARTEAFNSLHTFAKSAKKVPLRDNYGRFRRADVPVEANFGV